MKTFTVSFLFLLHVIFACAGYTQITKEIDSARYHYDKILKPSNYDEFNKALKFYKEGVNYAINNKDTLKAIKNLRLIAIGQTTYGLFAESEKTIVTALNLTEVISDNDIKRTMMVGLNNQLGMIYRRIQNYQKALFYYDRALLFIDTKDDSISLLNNKATIYKDLERYDLSKDILEEALKVAAQNKVQKKGQYARILANFGYMQFKLKNNEALLTMEQALYNRIEEKDLIGQYSSYNDLTEYFIEKDDHERAKSYFTKAYDIAKQINSPEYIENSLGQYALLTEDPKIIRFKNLKDSLEDARRLKENNYAAMKYDVDKEKELTHIAKVQQEKEKSKKNFYFFISIVILLVSVIIIYGILQKRKQRQLKAVQRTETSISKKIHDGLANDTFQILSELQNLQDIPEHILIKLDRIYQETRDIAKNHSPLIEGAGFEDQLISRLNSYRSTHLNVITRNVEKIKWESFSKIKRDTIYMVLGELMTNNKKHSQATLALISFEQNRKKLRMVYQDNGIGTALKKGNGMQNMEFRIRAINGNISFESELNKGLKVEIQI
ncbi:tetratricopeptide repeat-containing sensor histidine kinase [Flavimarina sp. Hel_I_48]|uniref:tetratricopeptide repeat-containing sensor histidine kinase n=1 Tax=Flavimarina sp. Hel_I_48 TaxID=1392488 RepID=UPI0004DF9E35|nr:tetratricopeptide repeat-containing sensor histidine kinase [Flavimarina sp. Hel_I_48]